eukprot:COSAG02_NODE_781_length_17261_cov_433.056054_9_plen_294_part_00
MYCSDNVQLKEHEKDDFSEVLGTVFCDQSWEKGSNAIRDHLDRLGSFTLSLCADGLVLAAAMIDYDPQDCTAAVIRMMATHPANRRRGCARLLNALIHSECHRRRVRFICVEVPNHRGERETGNDGHVVWNHFGYTGPQGGQLPELVGPLFKDTSLLVMTVHDDRESVRRATQQITVNGNHLHVAPVAAAAGRHSPPRAANDECAPAAQLAPIQAEQKEVETLATKQLENDTVARIDMDDDDDEPDGARASEPIIIDLTTDNQSLHVHLVGKPKSAHSLKSVKQEEEEEEEEG